MFSKLRLTRGKIAFAKILYKLIVPFFGKKPRRIKRGGINYEVDLSEGIDLPLFLFGGFQNHVTKNKLLPIPADALILDVGGNFGVMSLQFAKTAFKGRVIAFEPTHYAISKFTKNLRLNPELAKRIEIINSFVSASTNQNADIKAFSSWKVSGEKEKSEIHPVHLGTSKPTEGVGSVTLNDFCKQASLARIDLIKIDTDGHEYEVLQGAKECIMRFRPKIIFEVGQYVMKEKKIDFNFYVNYFSGLNYKLFDAETGKEITAANQLKIIPELGTIDVLAIPF